MFYVVDLTTGEVLAGPVPADGVDTAIDGLTAMYPLETLFVQGDCPSGYGLAAADWVA